MMDEVQILRDELEHYRREREKIRDLIGQIGGTGNKKRERNITIAFLVVVMAFFAFDVLRHVAGWHVPLLPPILLLEVGVLLVSLKIVWMMHKSSKVEHFQFWILNSIEFRLNTITSRLTTQEQLLREIGDASDRPEPAQSPAGGDGVA